MKRYESVDAFRGFTILGMILVNSPGSWGHVYKPLLHAEWDGCTLADMVFPFFLFIVGISVVIAYTKYLNEGISRILLLKKALFRMVILFCIGVALNVLMSDFREIRIPGVLQRIAIVYFICSLLFMYFPKKYIIGLASIVLFGYWLLLLWVPAPGQTAGILEPVLNIVNWVDSQVIPGVLYQETWDPEGLLSTMPAIATCISGMIAGWILMGTENIQRKRIRLILIGVSGVIAGLIWSIEFPLNKNLWTSSYVLYTSGYAFILLAVFDFLSGTGNFRKSIMPFIVSGSNALTLYIIHILMFFPLNRFSIGNFPGVQTLFMNFMRSMGLPQNMASLLWAVMFTLLCVIPAWVLYRRKLFLNV